MKLLEKSKKYMKLGYRMTFKFKETIQMNSSFPIIFILLCFQALFSFFTFEGKGKR